MKPIVAMNLTELRQRARTISHQVDALQGNLDKLNECPGYKRACGVSTPRERCFYCEKSRSLDQRRENR